MIYFFGSILYRSNGCDGRDLFYIQIFSLLVTWISANIWIEIQNKFCFIFTLKNFFIFLQNDIYKIKRVFNLKIIPHSLHSWSTVSTSFYHKTISFGLTYNVRWKTSYTIARLSTQKKYCTKNFHLDFISNLFTN